MFLRGVVCGPEVEVSTERYSVSSRKTQRDGLFQPAISHSGEASGMILRSKESQLCRLVSDRPGEVT